MSWIIYKHTNLLNGKSYIGQTCSKNPNRRWRSGKGYIENKQPYFKSAINKYGWGSFKHEILEDNIPTIELANKKEKYYIKKFNTYIGFKNCKGYNMTPGGDSKRGAWDEWEDKIIETYYPLEGIKCKSRLYKRDSTSIRNRASRLGVLSYDDSYTNEENKIIIERYPQEGTKISKIIKRTPTSISQQARKLGIKYLHNVYSKEEIDIIEDNYYIYKINYISKLLNRTEASVKAKIRQMGLDNKKKDSWSKIEDKLLMEQYSSKGRNSIIKGRSKEACKNRARQLGLKKENIKIYCPELVKIFKDSNEIEKNYKIHHSNVFNCCNGKRETAGGYHFCYYDDSKRMNELKIYEGQFPKQIYRKVRCINLNKTFNSISEAYKETKIRHISECCAGKLKTAGGYKWEYVK